MGTFNGLYMLIATSLTNVVASKNLPPPPSSCSERWRCLVSAAPCPRVYISVTRQSRRSVRLERPDSAGLSPDNRVMACEIQRVRP